MKMYDVAIIGAGVVGAAIARELARYNLKVTILEKENDVCMGTSKANSAIVHAGYDPPEGSLMARLNVEGNALYETLCQELSVPFKRNGALVLAFDEEELAHIEALKQRGTSNGVPSLEILTREELLEKEPNVNPEAKGALWAKTGALVDPMLLTIALVENAVQNGVDCRLRFPVVSITREEGGYRVSSQEQEIKAKYVINAAGVYADKIRGMVAPPTFEMKPRRGQYFLLDKAEGNIIKSTIFPCPGKGGKGILVVPSVHGNVLLGPASDDLLKREDVATTEEVLHEVRVGARYLVPDISVWSCIRTFAGVRATTDDDDFIIQEVLAAPGFIDVAGIKSPGLTAAPAIAHYVISILQEKGVELVKKENFDPIVERVLTMAMSEEERDKKIMENQLYGRVVCRCENITEGDIVDAIHRNPEATTLDGVKRRCRAGMGRCQGGFCGPKVQKIIARELNKPLEEIVLEKDGSYILTGRTK